MTPKNIIDACERYYNLDQGKVFEHCRTRTVAKARNLAMYLSRKHTEYSWQELGGWFKRHHSSVIQGYNRVSNSSDFNQAVTALEKELLNKRSWWIGRTL